jgi:23S rRNA pseudouridine2605 synthase
LRLQVFLSRSGVCSRRDAMALIFSGRVGVNGVVITEPSFDVNETDAVVCDGASVSLASKIYILLHKPKGVITTKSDRFAEKTVLDLLPKHLRHVHPVGRLDKDTTGLLLLTNDGGLTHRLSHPSFETQKLYRCLLHKELAPSDEALLEKGVMIDGKLTAPCRIKRLGARWVEVVLHEGRKRQIRRMFALAGYHVNELARIEQGILKLGDLEPGQWRYLSREEIRRLNTTQGIG